MPGPLLLDRPARSSAAPPAPDLSALVAAARDAAETLADEAGEVDRTRAFPARSFRQLADAGLLAAPLATARGGLGLATPGALHALYAVLREVGRGSLAVGRIYEGHVNALALLDEWGTEAQNDRAARDVQAGHVFGVWNTEIPSSGVRLHPGPEGVRMEGAKTFCSGLGGVTRAFANGALPDGRWQMALVPLDDADVEEDASWWTAEGMRGSVSGRVGFDGVVLDADALVGPPGAYTRDPSFNTGAVRFAAVQLGGAQALFDAAAAHLRQLGRTDHAVQRARLGEAAVALESGALWLLGAARLFARPGASVEDRVAYAQLARTAVERACLDVLERVDRAVGARGMLPPCPVERIGRDLRLYLRQPNPDGALDAAAGHLLQDRPPALGSDV